MSAKRTSRTFRRTYYLTLLRITWASLTPRQRRRLWSLEPLLAHALLHLIEDNLMEHV